MSYIRVGEISFGDSASIDAFGRARVSEPYTLFDSKQLHDAQPLFWDDSEVSGSGTSSAHSTAEAATTMSVGSGAGKRVRQTFRRFNYQPGKSQLIFVTFGEFDTTTGITKEVGYFDDDNGLFFRSDEGTLSVVRKSKVTGSAVDDAVAQSSWNIDTLDGNGASGITLDLTKTQIGIIDFEWLGVGRVRMGFVIDGLVYYCHEFLNTNVLTTVYMSTPNLPLRYSIENDGTGAADDFVHICSTVMSEGGREDTGIVLTKSTAGTHVDANTENTIYAIVGIKLKSTHLDAVVDLLSFTMQLAGASDKVEWSIYWNPTVAGSFTYSDITNSALQGATGASTNTVTGGTLLNAGFLESGAGAVGGSISQDLASALKLGSTISGTADEIVLCARPISGSTNVDVEGSLTWREIT